MRSHLARGWCAGAPRKTASHSLRYIGSTSASGKSRAADKMEDEEEERHTGFGAGNGDKGKDRETMQLLARVTRAAAHHIQRGFCRTPDRLWIQEVSLAKYLEEKV